jgi:hypothetical protein
MKQGARMVDTYEVKQSVYIGNKEVIFAVDDQKSEPYMVCNCTFENPLGIDFYSAGCVGNNYLEMMAEYLSRAQMQIESVRDEREELGLPFEPLTSDHCLPDTLAQDIEGQVIVIRADSLRPEYRTAEHQLMLATGGFGCKPGSSGRAVFCRNIYTGKETRWNIGDVLGVIKPECLPDWSKEHLSNEKAKPNKRQEPER